MTIVVDGTEVLIEGSGPSLVFIHGWPDTALLWDAQVAALARRYRCVRFTLPGFERPSRRAWSFEELVSRTRRIVETACPGERVTLVLHDWGSVLGWWFAARHPELIARIVLVDVGDGGSRRHLRELGVLPKLALGAYQLWLALAWRLGGRLGDWMSRSFARLIRAPAPRETIHAGMAYPYAVTWFGVAGGPPRHRPPLPDVPTMFAYGTRKPFMFHSRAWEEEIAAKRGNRVVPLDAGHWLMVTRAAAFDAAVAAWLADELPRDVPAHPS